MAGLRQANTRLEMLRDMAPAMNRFVQGPCTALLHVDVNVISVSKVGLEGSGLRT